MLNRTILVVLTIVACPAFGLDASCVDITVPPEVVSYDTTFVPQIAVKNNGPEFLFDVPVRFVIVRTSDPTDTIYHESSSVWVNSGQTVLFDFTSECCPDPGLYTMTGITSVAADTNRDNDTCSKPLFVRYADVAVEITSPRDTEQPGLVAVVVKLTNLDDVPALVPRLDVTIVPSGYHDYREAIGVGVGSNSVVTLTPWVCPSGSVETCTAWITYPADSNHANDTDVVIINATGVGDWTRMEPNAGMSLGLSSSPLAGNVLHVEYSLNRAGPAKVTLLDISGRVALACDFIGARTGELPLGLRGLKSGVYLVRLDDGRSSVTRKLVKGR